MRRESHRETVISFAPFYASLLSRSTCRNEQKIFRPALKIEIVSKNIRRKYLGALSVCSVSHWSEDRAFRENRLSLAKFAPLFLVSGRIAYPHARG
jgi:hypothetical protein